MSAQQADTNLKRYQVPDTLLYELKDKAAMLAMAGEYLCGEGFLKKTGEDIEQHADVLGNHVAELRRQLLTKKDEDSSLLDEDLERIAHIASLLKKADADTRHKCAEGKIGEELGEKVVSLSMGIKMLTERTEARPVAYTKSDSAFSMVDQLKTLFSAITFLAKFTLKTLVLLILVCVGLFFYLFLTMERETDLSKKIRQDRTDLNSRQAELSRTEGELQAAKIEIERLKKKRNRTSQEKIELMDANLKVFNLVEQKEKLEQELKVRARTLEENRRKLEELKTKPFMERLLGRLYELIPLMGKKWNEYVGGEA